MLAATQLGPPRVALYDSEYCGRVIMMSSLPSASAGMPNMVLLWYCAPVGTVVGSAMMSTDGRPAAAPSVALKVPSYDRNSTTLPPASTSAMPSGEPFWMPLLG